VTLRQGLEAPRLLLPLSRSRHTGYVRRGRYPLYAVVGREKRGNSTSIHANCFLGGAMPVGYSMPYTKGRMAHSLRLASWELPTPVTFVALSEHIRGVGGFSCLRAFRETQHFLKPYIRWCRAFVAILKHGSVLTQGTDLPWNLQALFCFQGTPEVFSHKEEKAEMQWLKPKKPASPLGLEAPWLAAGSVLSSWRKYLHAPIGEQPDRFTSP
jgi:hypothetical protein